MRTLWAVVLRQAMESLKTSTEFEQRASYFDGDPLSATKKGVNVLERRSQVHFMREFQALLDFPPAPKLGIDGKLDPARAAPAEMRGQELFFGKAQRSYVIGRLCLFVATSFRRARTICNNFSPTTLIQE